MSKGEDKMKPFYIIVDLRKLKLIQFKGQKIFETLKEIENVCLEKQINCNEIKIVAI